MAEGSRRGSTGRRVWALAAIVLLQAVAAAFFVGDALVDLRGDGWDAHVAVEGGIALALVAGVGRAQLAQVYAKAGVSSRAGLVALFFEDLLDGV